MRACSWDTMRSSARATPQPPPRPMVTSLVSGYTRPRCSGGSTTLSEPGLAGASPRFTPVIGAAAGPFGAAAAAGSLTLTHTARSTRRKNSQSRARNTSLKMLRSEDGNLRGLEAHLGGADRDDIAVRQHPFLDAGAVDPRAVGRAEIDDHDLAVLPPQLGVAAAHVLVGDDHI